MLGEASLIIFTFSNGVEIAFFSRTSFTKLVFTLISVKIPKPKKLPLKSNLSKNPLLYNK